MEIRRDVFQAIADPTRRQIIDMLSKNAMNVNTIAENFGQSRQAVSVHVKILMECGLVVINQQGRERLCEAKLDKLSEVAGWVAHYQKFWTTKFDALDQYLDNIQKPKNG
jgi:DNA-binding transcriptional ArsR family regulator